MKIPINIFRSKILKSKLGDATEIDLKEIMPERRNKIDPGDSISTAQITKRIPLGKMEQKQAYIFNGNHGLEFRVIGNTYWDCSSISLLPIGRTAWQNSKQPKEDQVYLMCNQTSASAFDIMFSLYTLWLPWAREYVAGYDQPGNH